MDAYLDAVKTSITMHVELHFPESFLGKPVDVSSGSCYTGDFQPDRMLLPADWKTKQLNMSYGAEKKDLPVQS